jgi:hypothetical protein
LDTEHPWIETIVEEKYIGKLYIGQTTMIHSVIPKSPEFVGHVTNIGAVVDVVSESNRNGEIKKEKGVIVKIFTPAENTKILKPGSSVKIKFLSQR